MAVPFHAAVVVLMMQWFCRASIHGVTQGCQNSFQHNFCRNLAEIGNCYLYTQNPHYYHHYEDLHRQFESGPPRPPTSPGPALGNSREQDLRQPALDPKHSVFRWFHFRPGELGVPVMNYASVNYFKSPMKL